MNNYLSKLENHSFIQEINKNYLSEIKDDWAKYGENNDTYTKKVFELLFQCLEVLKEIIICYKSLTLPTKKYLSGKKIKDTEYLKYHIQNRYIKVCTVFDLTLLLISEVQILGFKKQNCNFKQITQNSNTSKKLIIYIKKFEKGISGIKSIRNGITHWGLFNDEDMSKIDSLDYILNNLDSLKLKKEEIKKYKLLRKIKLKIVIGKYKVGIKNDLKEILKILDIIFDELLIEYSRNI